MSILKAYLLRKQISYGQFARMISVKNARTVQRYADGKRVPSGTIMARIMVATGGEIGPPDFPEVAKTDAPTLKAA